MAAADRTYRIRRASAADLPAVLAILAENRAGPPDGALPPAGPASGLQQATWERVLSTTDLTVCLAETGTEPAGAASTMLMPHLTYGCRPTAFIEAVVVRYAHRRRGVASLLLQHALEDAQAASCRKVQLLSHKRHSDDGAHQLYRALGFTPQAEGFRLYFDP